MVNREVVTMKLNKVQLNLPLKLLSGYAIIDV